MCGCRRLLSLLLMSTLLWLTVTPPIARADPPAIISIKSVASRSTLLAISWQFAPGATQYRVTTAPTGEPNSSRSLTTTATLAVVSGLRPHTQYSIRVTATSAEHEEIGQSPPQLATTEFALPVPVLASKEATVRSLGFAWRSPARGVALEAEWSPVLGSDPPATATARGPILSLTDLKPGTSYFLRTRFVDRAGRPLSEWADHGPVTTSRPVALRVGSYNVQCANCGSGSWGSRRNAVVRTILGQSLDVLGVQEVSQSQLKGRSTTQFLDLAHGLGSRYRLTYYGRARADQDVRVAYNTTTLRLIKSGARALPTASGANIRRYVDWAVFEQRATRQQFFFANTHLEPGKPQQSLRVRQVRELLRTIRSNNPNKLPVIVVGDFNSFKWMPGGNDPYDAMLASGYLDPLGNSYRSTWSTRNAIVEKRIRTNYSSFNDYRRVPPRFAYPNGTYLDYIFVSPMRVAEWETVVNVDSAGRFIGVIPSDHNLIRASVFLP